MTLSKTRSDAEHKRAIAYIEKQMSKVREGGWTWDKLNASLQWHKSQLALPRDQRSKYEDGSL